jgi:hypothetical protein
MIGARIGVATVVLAGGLVAGCLGPAGAPVATEPVHQEVEEWGRAFAVSGFGANVYDVTADARGGLAVIWDRKGIRVRKRLPGGGWQPAQLLGRNFAYPGPQVGADERGKLTVAWGRIRYGFVPEIVSRRQLPGARWSQPRILSPVVSDLHSHAEPWPLVLKVSKSGAAVAAWSFEGQVQAAYRPAHRRWRPWRTIARPQAGLAAAAIGPRGGVVVVFHDGRGRVGAVRRVGGRWAAPVTISRGGTAWPADVATSPGGRNTVAVWRRGRWIEASRLVDSEWTIPTRVGEADSEPRVAVDGAGVATVVWLLRGQVLAARGTPAGPFGDPELIATTHPDDDEWGVSFDLAVNGRGDAVVAWQETASGRPVVDAAYRPTQGGWLSPVRLAAARNGQLSLPAVTVDPRGHADALWIKTDDRFANGRVWLRQRVASDG